MRYDNVIDID